MKIYQLITDGDGGTECHDFATEKQRDAFAYQLCQDMWWEGLGKAIPECWREAYAILTDGDCVYYLTSHEVDLDALLGGKVTVDTDKHRLCGLSPERAAVFEQRARKRCNEDLEIDDKPRFSPSDEGCWVNAWIYITNAEAGIDLDKDEATPTLKEGEAA